VQDHLRVADNNGTNWLKEGQSPTWVNAIGLLVWLFAGAVAFLPFAFNTSPWDAVTLRVPGNQGNWWHVLVGAPFFLAYPMIWLRLRLLFSTQLSTARGTTLDLERRRPLNWCHDIGAGAISVAPRRNQRMATPLGAELGLRHRNCQCSRFVPTPRPLLSYLGMSCRSRCRLSC
jgi:hypothetical protein